MKNSTLINWKNKTGKQLEKELNKAIAQFNKKLNELQIDGAREYLPDFYSYKETKDKIKTKEQLRKVVSDLRAFTKQGAEELINLESGESITRWEKNKLHFENLRAQKRLRQEIAEYNKPLADSGFTRAQMGSKELRKLESKLEKLKEFENKKGQDFQNWKKRIGVLGSYDFEIRKAIQYRKNYMKTIDDYFKNLDGYKELKKAFNEHKDPIGFFEWIKASGNINIIDISFESNNVFTQEEFYKFLEDLNIEYEKNIEVVERN